MQKFTRNVAVMAVVAVAAIGADYGLTNHAAHHTSNVSASAQTAVAHDGETPDQKWFNHKSGKTQLLAIKSDANNMSTDANNDDETAVQGDCSQLAEDAQLAAANPPPVDGTDYTNAMDAYAQGGTECALAVTDDSSSEMDTAVADIENGTSLLNETSTETELTNSSTSS